MAGEVSDVVVLTSVATEAEAVMIVAVLEDSGLRATITGELTSGFRASAPGEVGVLVCRAELRAAKQILDNRRTHQPD